MAVLPILGQLIVAYGKLFLAVSPALVTAFIGLAEAIGYVLTEITKLGPIGDYAIAIALLAGKLGLAGAAFSLFRGIVTSIAPGLAGTAAGMIGLGGAADKAAVQTQMAALKIDTAVEGFPEALATATPLVQVEMDKINNAFMGGAISAREAQEQIEQAALDISADLEEMGMSADAAAAGVDAAFVEIGVASDAAAASVTASASIMDIALGSTGVGLVVVGLGIAVTVLATHWQEALHDILAWTSNAANFIVQYSNEIAVGLYLLVPGLGIVLAATVELATHWKSAWNDMKVIALAMSQDVENAFDTLINGASKAWGDLEHGVVALVKAMGQDVENAFDAMVNGVSKAWGDLGNGVSATWTGIVNDIGDAADTMVNSVTGAFSGMVNGVISALNGLVKAIDSIKWPTYKIFGKTVFPGFGGVGLDQIPGVNLRDKSQYERSWYPIGWRLLWWYRSRFA